MKLLSVSRQTSDALKSLRSTATSTDSSPWSARTAPARARCSARSSGRCTAARGRGRAAHPPRRAVPTARRASWRSEFEVAGHAYRVRRDERARTPSWSTWPAARRCVAGWKRPSREVATRLGLTREMFRGTFYARQREVQALDSSDEVRRREQVELLLGIERLRRATAPCPRPRSRSSAMWSLPWKRARPTSMRRAPTPSASPARPSRQLPRCRPPSSASSAPAPAARRPARHSTRCGLEEREMLGRRGRAQTAQAEPNRRVAHGMRSKLRCTEAEAAERSWPSSRPSPSRPKRSPCASARWTSRGPSTNEPRRCASSSAERSRPLPGSPPAGRPRQCWRGRRRGRWRQRQPARRARGAAGADPGGRAARRHAARPAADDRRSASSADSAD